MENFVFEKRGALPPELCSQIIERFESDSRKAHGVTGQGYNPTLKRSTDLYITLYPEWKDIDIALYESLKLGAEEYATKFEILKTFLLQDQGYQIQRTLPGEFYEWHSDCVFSCLDRQYTFIWYLNDVEGGETELKYLGLKIAPETGKLLLFPAFWTHTHRGNVPKNTKYIVTGWICMATAQKLG